MGRVGGAAPARWCAAAMLAAAAFSANAGSLQEQAVEGAVADGVSTALGIAAGAVELNPLGPLLGVGMKLAMMEYAKGLPETQRPGVYAKAASLWQGAAANNVCVAASLLSGGAFAPACIALGVAWGMKTWNDTEHEREFWASCESQREAAQDPEMVCIYVPPGHPAAQEHLAAQQPQLIVQVLEEPQF